MSGDIDFSDPFMCEMEIGRLIDENQMLVAQAEKLSSKVILSSSIRTRFNLPNWFSWSFLFWRWNLKDNELFSFYGTWDVGKRIILITFRWAFNQIRNEHSPFPQQHCSDNFSGIKTA